MDEYDDIKSGVVTFAETKSEHDEETTIKSSIQNENNEETTTKSAIKGENENENENDDDEDDEKEKLRKSVHSQMLSFKEKGSFEMKEDVYAFITVAPVFSSPFMLACIVIGTKYIVYGTLISGITFSGLDDEMPKRVTMIKFFLIPIAVSMQADLMAVYEKIANIRYDPGVLTISKTATRTKFNFSYALRFIDGALSLTANFLTMLSTNTTLGVFLNFAALHFLQDIDDVIYNLVAKGFYGDSIEHMSVTCRKISWPRRVGDDNTKFLGCLRVSHLDTILYFITYLVCLSFYIVHTIEMHAANIDFDHLFERLSNTADKADAEVGSF